jgi:hypothetical protein
MAALPSLFHTISIFLGSWKPWNAEFHSEAVSKTLDESETRRTLGLLGHIAENADFANACLKLIVYAYAKEGRVEIRGS